MNTPFEIICTLPFVDVIKLTLLVLKVKSIKDRTLYDNVTAKDWIIENAGISVYENFLEPLLQSKFGTNKDKVSAAWLLGRVTIRSNRGTKGEKLGYMRGGFHILMEKMINSIQEKGGKVINGKVSKIETIDGVLKGVVANGKYIECDRIISTVAPNVLEKND